MPEKENKKNHFLLGDNSETEPFSPPNQRIPSPNIPQPNRQRHGSRLLGNIETIRLQMDEARIIQQNARLDDGLGLQVEFEGIPEVELAFERLARDKSGIELLNVRKSGNKTLATVFVPDGKLDHFERLIRDYLEEKRDRAGNLRDNKYLINTIQEIRAASIRALWTDDESVFPEDDDELFWWEVWLPVRRDRYATTASFRRLAEMLQIRVAEEEFEFPERTVLLVHSTKSRMQSSMMTLNSIAELRRAKETADFFDSSPSEEQANWLENLLDRCFFTSDNGSTPYICLLDTGVNNRHPLLSASLADDDLHSVEPTWGTNDQDSHGTAMAGIALVGDLTDLLIKNENVSIDHRLESVKLIPANGGNQGDAQHHGYLTAEAIARPEIGTPHRERIYGMAVTAKDNRDRGKPSAWSAAIDRLAVDSFGEGATPRLIFISAGNIQDSNAWSEYPSSNTTDGIHDPGQAWNALTIGAFTNLVDIAEDDTENYQPIAPAGGLSPFSTTSATWEKHWPIKPDIVLEGGNAANDGLGAVWLSSLSLLTCNNDLTKHLFTTINATSAATALACQMAAELKVAYPTLWPESVRALMVHSSEWTDAMRRIYLPDGRSPNKSNYLHLIRHCGFGVPNLDRAMWSMSNSLVMIVETDLQPFQREPGNQPKLKDMNLHKLPWPLEELEALGETEVEMRVTLSYFIEPNPSNRGFKSKYRYESHGLRFDVKRPLESVDGFRSRINRLARLEGEGSRRNGDDLNWLIGTQNRHRGSLNSDIWKGNAADLASRGVIAVYPTLGWWKTRTALERYDHKTRYSLIVSIHAPEVDVNLYTTVQNQITTPVEITS